MVPKLPLRAEMWTHFWAIQTLQEYPYGRKNPPNNIWKAPYVLHEKSDNKGDTDSSEDGNLY